MSEFIYYPDENLLIVLLNNFGTYGQNIWAVGMGISSIVVGLPYDNWKVRNEVIVEKEVLRRHIGMYINGKNKLELKLNDGKLFIMIAGLSEMQLYAESDNDFFLRDFNTSFHFDNNILTVHEHGENSKWKRK